MTHQHHALRALRRMDMHGDSSEFNGIHQEMLDNKIDAFSKTFQAMTISCARCHDHKLDAVAQREYYALAGVFMSSRWVTNTADLPGRNARVFGELKKIKVKLRPLLAGVWLDDAQRLSTDDWSRLSTAQKKLPPLENPLQIWKLLEADPRPRARPAFCTTRPPNAWYARETGSFPSGSSSSSK